MSNDTNASIQQDAYSLVGVPERLSHYQIIGTLGTGGMATVYKARDTSLDRIVALKVLRPDKSADREWSTRFLREARAAANLVHPRIATVYEIGEENGFHFISMEYVEGSTLSEILKGGPLQFAEVIEIGTEVCDALLWSHSRGAIHRDIKPANLILTTTGDVKILDFGLVKVTVQTETSSTAETVDNTSSGVLVGSVPYMSPEQALGQELDARTDIFSLGVTLYQLVTGQLPFAGVTAGDTLDQILHRRPVAISHFNIPVPLELERIVHKCLEKDRDWRYASADGLMKDLVDLGRSLSVAPAAAAHLDSLVPSKEPETFPGIDSTSNAIDGHIFNDDLLMNPQDLAYATAQFSPVIHVLDYPRLRQKFAQYESRARHARNMVRRLGLSAVAFAAVALIALAMLPALSQVGGQPQFAFVVEWSALGAATVAAASLWFGPWKRRWLENRLMAEQLRQWQFQTLVRRCEPIEKSCSGPSAVADFKKQRDLWFDDFLRTLEGKLDVNLESLTMEPSGVERWVHDKPSAYSDRSPALIHVRRAYERLRLDRQFDYAVWKLRTSTDKPIWRFLEWPPVCQMKALSGIAHASFACALICAAILMRGQIVGMAGGIEMSTRSFAVSFVLMGAALRTIRNAVAPEREIERYNDYRAITSHLRDRFKHATDTKEVHYLMQRMEIAAVDEMKGFLRAGRDSRLFLI